MPIGLYIGIGMFALLIASGGYNKYQSSKIENLKLISSQFEQSNKSLYDSIAKKTEEGLKADKVNRASIKDSRRLKRELSQAKRDLNKIGEKNHEAQEYFDTGINRDVLVELCKGQSCAPGVNPKADDPNQPVNTERSTEAARGNE